MSAEDHDTGECSADRETGNIWYADPDESPQSLFDGAAIYCFVTLVSAASLAVIAWGCWLDLSTIFQ